MRHAEFISLGLQSLVTQYVAPSRSAVRAGCRNIGAISFGAFFMPLWALVGSPQDKLFQPSDRIAKLNLQNLFCSIWLHC